MKSTAAFPSFSTFLLIPLLFCAAAHAGGGAEKEERMNPPSARQENRPAGEVPLREAMYYEKLDGSEVCCGLCFRRCLIAEGERGECRNRVNIDGALYSLVYARPAAVQVDPIEKEPQNHMLPGTPILCFGTAGCNFHCKFCHNWHLSQRTQEEMGTVYRVTPEAAVERAMAEEIPTISFTYNEPTTFYEYVYDVAKLAKERGLNILWHSNGAMNPEPLRALLQYTDAVTIDLKGFTEKFYRQLSQAELEPVLRTLRIITDAGVWLEIVNLLIPTYNDDPRDVRRMCEWIRDNLGTHVPLHFNRFVPAHLLLNLAPTPVETLERAHAIAREVGLEYVYIGNVPGHPCNSTYCPACGEVVIQRRHFWVVQNAMVDGRCANCGHAIPGLWESGSE